MIWQDKKRGGENPASQGIIEKYGLYFAEPAAFLHWIAFVA
jgi:hypothetical protein